MLPAKQIPDTWVDGGPLPTIVFRPDLHFLCETEHVATFGGLDTGGRLQIHNEIEDPRRNFREAHENLETGIRILRDRFGLYNIFTVATDERNFKYNKLFGFQSALVSYMVDTGELWEIMVRYF